MDDTVDPADGLQPGDLGYFCDRDGAYIVTDIDQQGNTHVKHDRGEWDPMVLTRDETMDENWAWYVGKS